MTERPPEREVPLLVRLRAGRQRHRSRHPLLRTLVLVFGCVCLLTGLAMVVLPGPGLLVTVIGLAVLALEFEWAERWLVAGAARSRKLRALLVRSRLLLVLFAIADSLVLAALLAAIFVLHWDVLSF
jgi:uncharacterized protein (TIGR02611 family)